MRKSKLKDGAITGVTAGKLFIDYPVRALIGVRTGWGYIVRIIKNDKLWRVYTAGDSRFDSQGYGVGRDPAAKFKGVVLNEKKLTDYAVSTAREMMKEASGSVGPIWRQDHLAVGQPRDMRHTENPQYGKTRYRHSRLKSKSRFDKRSFRTIKIGKHGRLLRVACPKGKWKRGRCAVGMQGQGILTPKKYTKLLRITRSRVRRLAANSRS